MLRKFHDVPTMKMFSRMLTAFLLEAVKSGLKMLFPPEKQCPRVINKSSDKSSEATQLWGEK